MREKMLVRIQFKLSVGFYLIITEKAHTNILGRLALCQVVSILQ